MDAAGQGRRAGWIAAIARGAAVFAVLGAVAGGIAASVTWPLVATFFGAGFGAGMGALVGMVDAVALTALAGRTRSPWPARAVSAAISGAVAVLLAGHYSGPPGWQQVASLALLVAFAALGAALGPAIAFGVSPEPRTRRGRSPAALFGLILAWGTALAAGVGAVAGLVIGLLSYPPTAYFAVLELAVLAGVSGAVLACLVGAVAVLPRLRARP